MTDRPPEPVEDTDASPDVAEVLGIEDLPATPVRVIGYVRVDQVPTDLEVVKRIDLPAGAAPQRVLDRSPRRGRVTLWAAGADVVIGKSQSEAGSNWGPVLSSGLQVPVHFAFASELWARAADGAAATAVLNVVTESWSR